MGLPLTASGKQMIYGLDCQADRLLDSSPDTEEKTEPILKTDPETASLTGWPRIYGLAPQTVINWIKKINWRIFLQIKS